MSTAQEQKREFHKKYRERKRVERAERIRRVGVDFNQVGIVLNPEQMDWVHHTLVCKWQEGYVKGYNDHVIKSEGIESLSDEVPED